MTNTVRVALSLALALAAVTPAGATAPAAAPGAAQPAPAVTRFKCQDGGDITAQFVSQNAKLIAIVDGGEGSHALPLVPWTGGPVQLTWSDGRRTLTWSPGVQIMWMDGPTHRMCGRGGHDHGAPAREVAVPTSTT